MTLAVAAAPAGAPQICENLLISTSDLYVSEKYQRARDENRCQRYAGNFDPNLFHTLVVERNGRDGWNVNDGSHRLRVAEILGIGEVWCQIIQTTQPGETFAAANRERKAIAPYDSHRALLSDRNSQALRVEHLLAAHGFRIGSNTNHPGTVSGVTTIYRLMFGGKTKIGSVKQTARAHEAELAVALGIIKAAWGSDTSDGRSRNGVMIEALAEFVGTAADRLDQARLVATLATKPAVMWMNEGKVAAVSGLTGRNSVHVARAVANSYNRGLPRRDQIREITRLA